MKNRKIKTIRLSILLTSILLASVFSCKNLNSNPPSPKHIILFIGDGMHLENEIAASRYLYGTDRGLSFHAFSYKGTIATWDISTYNRYAALISPGTVFTNGFHQTPELLAPLYGYNSAKGGAKPYPDASIPDTSYFTSAIPDEKGINPTVPATDSASAASALATGYKYRNGVISWNEVSNKPADSILSQVRSLKRFQTGIISTVPFSHATPAAFAAHNISRASTADIASEIIHTTKPEIVIAGGHPAFYSGGYSYISEADYTSLKNNQTDYLFAERTEGKNAAGILEASSDEAIRTGQKFFALFGGAEANFGYNTVSSDGSSAITASNHENPTLSDAVTTALKIFAARKTSFFLMAEQGDIDWANHAIDYRRMISSMNDLNNAVKAASDFIDIPDDDIDWSNTLIIVTADHANGFIRLNDPSHASLGKGFLPVQSTSPTAYPGGEVSYGTPGAHTNEPVTLYAKGKDSERFSSYEGTWYPGTSIIDNTQIYRVLAESAGIAH